MNKFLLLVIPFFFSFISVHAQTSLPFNSGITNWVCPAGVTSIKVEAWGSGSGGNNINGGGGGAFAGNNTVTVIPGDTYVVTVGAGGNSGNNGQGSSFGTLVIAEGAIGAEGGLASGSTGVIKYNGGDGGSSSGNSGAGGGGGGGSLGAGRNGLNSGGNLVGAGGLGGLGNGGRGGDGGANKGSGNDSSSPGGGGGARGNNGLTDGKGGNGRVVITYACKVYNLISVSVPISACTPPSTIAVTLTGSATDLPVGNYIVTYTRSDPNATGLKASMTVATPGTGTFTAVGLTNPDNVGTTITVTNLESSSCSNAITSNNISNTFVLRAPLSAPSGLNGYGSCPNYIIQWNNGSPRVENYFLDVSASEDFGTFLPGYYNKDLGTAFSATIIGLTGGTKYYYRVRAANVCGTSGNSNVSSFVAPGASVAPITGGSSTVCIGSQTPAFNDVTTGGTWSILNGTGSATITSGGVVSGSTAGNVTVVYSVSNNGCASTVTMPLTVNAIPSKPAVVPNQPNCNLNKGSIFVSNLPTSGILIQTVGGVMTNYTITGQTMNIIGLAPGDYTFRVSVGSCNSAVSDIVKINPVVTTSWTGTSWTKGIPTLSDEAIINANYNTAIHGKIDACSLIINNALLTIGAQNFVTIQNDLTVNPSGTIKVLDQGSLVLINDSGTVTYKGVIEVNKTTTPFEKYDYTYWSSPIVGPANIGATFANWNTDYAFAFHPENFIDANNDGFDDNGDDYINASTMDTGRGYIIMGPTSGSFPRTESVVFAGKVNSGVVTTPIVLTPGSDPEDDFNLVGNPYPSAISADALIKANISGTGTINKTIEGTLYFWTHKADISVSNPGPDGLNFSQDDYAVYNLSGGIGTSGSASGGGKPLGYIASGQGFFVEADVAGYLTFNNSMRVSPSIVSSQPTPTNANTQFYKILPTKEKAVSKDRVWLNLENEDGMFSQQLVGYFENTTIGIDNGYDGLVSDAGNYVSFYSFIDDGVYKIQGRQSFDKKDQVRLGYFSAVAGPFNINIDSKEGVFDEDQTSVYLEDKLTNTIHDLKNGPYSFETEIGTFNDRFVLRYTDKTLGTGDFDKANKQVIVSVKNKQININSEIEMINKILIFDISGKLIYKKVNIDNNEITVLNLISGEQTLLVKIVLENGQTVTRKIIY